MEKKTTTLLKNPQHQSYLMDSLGSFLERKELIDTTIVCTDQEDNHQNFDCHRIVLAACSPFFAKLYTDVYQGSNSLVVLPKDVRGEDWALLLKYIYHGSVQVPKLNIDRVLDAAKTLRIQGLVEYQKDPEEEDIFPTHQQQRQIAMQTASWHQLLYHHHENVKDSSRSPWSRSEEGRNLKAYSNQDMDEALLALRSQSLSLTRASENFRIPATTLWQRANKLGIPTPKKENVTKTWSDEDLDSALEALRRKEMSANKASKQFGVPSSTLYKMARREKIELAPPFNAIQTSWSSERLEKALESIRRGVPVMTAAVNFGIPTGTLYGRCKRAGIVLTKANSTQQWSEEDMKKAQKSVFDGNLTINQASILHKIPYSSLHGRMNKIFKRNGELNQ